LLFSIPVAFVVVHDMSAGAWAALLREILGALMMGLACGNAITWKVFRTPAISLLGLMVFAILVSSVGWGAR
jgi:hypothetical protein